MQAQLSNLARETQRPLDQLLTRYALERLLYRLSLSTYRDRYAKDCYNVWALLATREPDQQRLAGAIGATFQRRGTDLPADTPDALSAVFAANDARKAQWLAFTRNVEREAPALDTVVAQLEAWLMPVVRRLSSRQGPRFREEP